MKVSPRGHKNKGKNPTVQAIETSYYSPLQAKSWLAPCWIAQKNTPESQCDLCAKVSWLLGALSPVNHKGLHQGWKQASIYLLVIYSTSHYTASLFFSFFSNRIPNYIHNFGTKAQKNSNTCFGACLYSAGTQHRNLHHMSVTMYRVTYLIRRAYTRTGVSHS